MNEQGKRKREEVEKGNERKREGVEVMKKEKEKEEEGEEEVVRKRKEEEMKKKRFECGICLELMSWEKEPRMLYCCGLSFCSLCLNKLFLLQNPSATSSSSFSSSSSSEKKKGVKCPVCGQVNECETIETLEMNSLIPETIDILSSSNLFPLFSHSLPNHSEFQGKRVKEKECANFEMCGERTQMFCPNCKMFVCDTCDPSHTSTVFTRNHKRSEQRNIRNGDEQCEDWGNGGLVAVGLEELKKKECSQHPFETISGYCFQCSLFVCLCCALDTHTEHKEKVKSIKGSILQKRSEVVEIGGGLEKRLIVVEEKRKKIEKEMKELEEKLEKKKIEKKEIELEKEDLRIRQDSIIRLSNTPTDISLFDDQLFSTLLQTANDIVSEEGLESGFLSLSNSRTKGVIGCDDPDDPFRCISSFPLKKLPSAVSVNSKGNIFVCVFGGLSVRDKDGNVLESIQKTIDSFHFAPVDVTIGLNDQIVVLDWSRSERRVVILSKEGELMKSFGSNGSQDGQFNAPLGVDVDGEGRIIVADSDNHRIQVFDNDGSFIRSFGSKGSPKGQFNEPRGVAVDGDGNIVVCDYANHRIEMMDIEGNFIRCFGTQGSLHSQFEYPTSVDVDGKGRIVVCDSGNRRVSVFEKDGTFLFSFGKDRMKNPCGVVVDSFGSVLVSDGEKNSIVLWSNLFSYSLFLF